jgi:hypothetical protein
LWGEYYVAQKRSDGWPMCSSIRRQERKTNMEVVPMNEELKAIILREHPTGIWVVLAEELPQSFEPNWGELAGHPITELSQAAESCFVPR